MHSIKFAPREAINRPVIRLKYLTLAK